MTMDKLLALSLIQYELCMDVTLFKDESVSGGALWGCQLEKATEKQGKGFHLEDPEEW